MIQKVTEAFQQYYYLRLHGIHRFEPKIRINQKVGSFRLKTAETSEELKKAFQLRFEVFQHELRGLSKTNGWDIDEYDFHCDHLIILDEKDGRIAGTCRLNTDPDQTHFYSAREFNLSRVLQTDGAKLELGRVCIKQEYRRGVVIALLWKGIAEYIGRSHSHILFGCATFPTKTAREAALLHRHFFEERKYTAEYFCPPTLAYKMPDFDAWETHFRRTLTPQEKLEADNLIPKLCKSYLKMGAFLGGEPAWDEEFKCIDFLTILHREDLSRYLWDRHRPQIA